MKKCYTCGEDKTKKEFNKNKCKRDGLNTICKLCSRKVSQKYYKENRKKHISDVARRNQKYFNTLHKFLCNYLREHPCVSCKEDDVLVLDFDHLGNKFLGIAQMACLGYSIAKVQKEIGKCQVLCRNCHARKTHKELNTFKYRIVNNLGSKL